MKNQVIVIAFACGLMACGLVACSSGGGGGPASLPFDPFGTEAPPSGTEPAGGGNESPPRGGVSVDQLCAYVCQRFQSSCPASGACTASDCTSVASSYPNCKGQFQAYLACLATAPLQCDDYGLQLPAACMSAVQTFQDCIDNVNVARESSP